MYRLTMLALFVLCVIADIFSLLWMLVSIITGSSRALHIAFAKDQSANTAIGGHWDETISSRAWRCQSDSRTWHYARILIDTLFWMDENHCEKSYLTEKEEAREWLEGVSE